MRSSTRHDPACAGDTRVRLPGRCPREPFAGSSVSDASSRTSPSVSRWSRTGRPPPPPPWRWLSLPGSGRGRRRRPPGAAGRRGVRAPAATCTAGGRSRRRRRPAQRASVDAKVPEAMPSWSASRRSSSRCRAGWKETAPSGGATFAAAAPGGEADVMLWIEQDPKLDFATFEAARSTSSRASPAAPASSSATRAHPGDDHQPDRADLGAPEDAPELRGPDQRRAQRLLVLPRGHEPARRADPRRPTA